MLIKPGLSLATYSVWIVRIDLVPVLQAGCRARSELELRGEGWDKKIYLTIFDTADSCFDFHWLKYHPDH